MKNCFSPFLYEYVRRWGEEKRRNDPEIFCRLAIEQKSEQCSTNPLWIICDIRRYTDIDFFRKYFPEKILLVRIEASIETRTKRGWIFTEDIDNAESECQLDKNVQWSFVFHNDKPENFNKQLNELMQLI